VDVDGKITSEYKPQSDEWVPEGKVTTKVFDEVIKNWYNESDTPGSLFGEAVTEKNVREGHTKVTTELEEIMTAVASGSSGGGSNGGSGSSGGGSGSSGNSLFYFVYNGEGTQHIDAKSTVRKETSGSSIASYSEYETEKIDRTFHLAIPTNSTEDYEWDIVSGSGSSGGERGWEYKFDPAVQTKPYQNNNALKNIIGSDAFLGNGTSTYKESLNGYYSDSYKGNEIYNTATETWILTSGYGGGSGEKNCTSNNTLDASLSMYITKEPVGREPSGNLIEVDRFATGGTYHSTQEIKDAEKFRTEFTVVNGAWQREVFGEDEKITKDTYNFSVGGSYSYSFEGSALLTTTVNASGSRTFTMTKTDEWKIDTTGTKTMLSSVTKFEESRNDRFFRDYRAGSAVWNTETYEQQYNETTIKHGHAFASVDGTATGKKVFDRSSGYSGTDPFRGDFYLDSTTNLPACSFTVSILGVVSQVNDDARLNFGTLATMHLDTFTGYAGSVTLDYNASGVGLTFGGPSQLPAGFFDSGIEQYLPKQEAAKYEPMDVSGVTPSTPEILSNVTAPYNNVNLGKLGKEIKDTYVNRGLVGILFWGYNYGTWHMPYQFDDDGSIENASIPARRQFLVDYFYKMCEQTQMEEGQYYKVEIPKWTTIWKTIPKSGKNGYDFKVSPVEGVWKFNQASFWFGGMWDFQVMGAYEICITPHPYHSDLKLAEIRNAALQWRWVDRIDANEYWNYNWKENGTLEGILEGLVDLGGDKRLGASFDIHVNYKDSNKYLLRIGAGGMITDDFPDYPRVNIQKE